MKDKSAIERGTPMESARSDDISRRGKQAGARWVVAGGVFPDTETPMASVQSDDVTPEDWIKVM